jgi:hypothetical protein
MHQLTLQLPDDVYAPLLDRAQRAGKSPEAVAADFVSTCVSSSESDPLIALLGSIDSDLTDVAERHDEYIGAELMRRTREIG